jgi:hypothetical protein
MDLNTYICDVFAIAESPKGVEAGKTHVHKRRN